MMADLLMTPESFACLMCLLCVVGYMVHAFFNERQMQLYFHRTEANMAVLDGLGDLMKGYKPSVFVPFHMVNMLFSVKKVKCLNHFERQYVQLDDGERISLDWLPKNYATMEDATPVVIMVPGITSDSRATYANVFAKYAVEDYKFRVAIMNRRGYCKMPYSKEDPDPITWDKFSDLEKVLQVVNEEFPKSNIYLAGVSMGANHIQRFAGMKGKAGEPINVKAIGCISSPYCLKTAAGIVNKNIILKKAMLKTLLETFENHLHCDKFKKALLKRNIDPKLVLKAKCSDEFNKLFSLHFTQYQDLDAYKSSVSSVGYIKSIEVPTLAINSRNDIVSPHQAIPLDEIKQNANFIQVMVNGGGHMEYFSGCNLRRWSFDMVLSYFAQMEAGLMTSDGDSSTTDSISQQS